MHKAVRYLLAFLWMLLVLAAIIALTYPYPR